MRRKQVGRGTGAIEILRSNGQTPEPKLALFINGRWVKAPPSEIALFARLYDEIGYVVPYRTLCAELGHDGTSDKQKHILRQYIVKVRQILRRYKAPSAIAAVDELGYTLCRVRKQSPRKSRSTRTSARRGGTSVGLRRLGSLPVSIRD